MADINILDQSMTSYAGTPLFNIVYTKEYTGYPAWRVFDNIQSGRALLAGDNYALLTGNYYGLTTKQNKTYVINSFRYSSSYPSQSSGQFALEYYDGENWHRHSTYNKTLSDGVYLEIDLSSSPMIGKGFRIYWDIATFADSGEVQFIGKEAPTYYIIQDGNELKTYTTQWNTIGTYPPSFELFVSSGMSTLPQLTSSHLSQLANNSKILCATYSTSKQLNTSITNLSKIIKSNTFILSETENIDSINITSTSDIKCFISPDNGNKWYSYVNNIWTEYELNLHNLTNSGMDINTFNAINSNFNSLLINKTLNFAFLLPTNSNYVDAIQYTADLKGSWAKSKHKLEYNYSLINTKIYFNAFIPRVIKITY